MTCGQGSELGSMTFKQWGLYCANSRSLMALDFGARACTAPLFPLCTIGTCLDSETPHHDHTR